ncbi:MAG: hypothetical protein DCC68_22670 [Planctomycetota bacterium]|nr:MAG: hypothetical protein DCC68_22670 [Planctomycetota bacterium]
MNPQLKSPDGLSRSTDASRRSQPVMSRNRPLGVEQLESRDLPGHLIGQHIHPILEIELDGQPVTIPANIGLTPTRHYSPHTHDTAGTLHLGEGPISGIDPLGSPGRLTTLKDFFDVWRTTNPGTPANNPNAIFSSTRLLDRTADATHAVFMTVNGQPNSSYESYSPHDGDMVVLSYQQVVNRGPIASSQTVNSTQGATVSITLTGDDGNPEEVVQTLRFRVQSLPANGTLRDSSGNSVAVGAELPSPTVTFVANAAFAGTDRFSFVATDNGGTANGGQDTSAPAEVTINVADSGANRPPTPTPQNARVAPGTTSTIVLAGDDGDPGVNQSLSFRVQNLPESGILRDSTGNPVTAGAALPSANLTYTPNAGFTGLDGFTFNVADDGTGRTGAPLPSQGVAVVSLNVTNVQPADPAGVVYVDFNNNGVLDAAEPGIGGVLMELCGKEDGGNSVHLTQVTAADGTYRFDQLWPGVYAVMEAQPSGYLDGQESLGTMGGTVGNDRFMNIVLGPGDIGEDYNFGELPLRQEASGAIPRKLL